MRALLNAPDLFVYGFLFAVPALLLAHQSKLRTLLSVALLRACSPRQSRSG